MRKYGNLGRNNEPYKIKWKVPSDDGWKRVPIDKMPTPNILGILNKFDKKGYSKIRGLVNNEDTWMIQYITELETELVKRTDIDEYL